MIFNDPNDLGKVAEVVGWQRNRTNNKAYFKNCSRVRRALENFGIARGARWRDAAHHWWNAAQNADRWRARLRTGWRKGHSNDPGSDVNSDSVGDGGAWPRASDFVNYHRSRRVLRCRECRYRTHIAPWLDAHVARMHPVPRQGQG